MAEARRPRLEHIDGLRGVAALLVVVFHLVELSPARTELLDAMGPIAEKWSVLGIVGVDIFFLLSGYVLLRSLDRTRTSGGSFIVRRQLRLDPAYWVCIVVTLASVTLQGLIPGLTSGVHYSPLDLLVNVVYLQGILDRPMIVSVSWTLCLEVQLYLLLLLVVTTLRRIRIPSWVLPAVLAVSALAAIALTEVVGEANRFVWGPWPLFCVGCLLYAGVKDKVWLGVGLVLFGVAMVPHFDLLVAVPLAAAIAAVMGLRVPVTVLSHRRIAWVGLRSYSLYLFHLIAIDLTTRIIYKITPNLAVSVLTAVISLVTSILLADLVFRYVERPSMRLAEMSKSSSARELLRWGTVKRVWASVQT